jgi:hypothetical protein
VDPAWLSLRGPADARARTTFASDLAGALAEHLTGGTRPPEVVRLVDAGAGTGAGARWLRDRLEDRLPMPQDWRLVDHDRDLLDVAAPTVEGWARGVVATVEELPGLLGDEPADVVTCQALLDVLTSHEVDALLGPAVESGAAVLLALSVDGDVALSPQHPDDDMVAEAFDAHQRRSGRLGPDGGTYAAHDLRMHGYTVTMAATPWRLGAADNALTRAWAQGRAEAAGEQEPRLADRVRRWYEIRDRQARDGDLNAVVGHVDVLGLPPRPAVRP